MGYLTAVRRGRGDYGASYRGDPGFFGFIGKAVKGALGIAGGLLPGPIGGIARLGSRLLGGRPAAAPALQRFPGGIPISMGPISKLALGARGVAAGPAVFGAPRRRRMNPGNVKALRRAMRRQESFVKLARRALKGSKYAITTRGASRVPRTVHIRESGPGGVTVGR